MAASCPTPPCKARSSARTQNVASNAIEVYVYRPRKSLAEAVATVQIHTIRGAGYLMGVTKNS